MATPCPISADIGVAPIGDGLPWPQLNEDYSVLGLMKRGVRNGEMEGGEGGTDDFTG